MTTWTRGEIAMVGVAVGRAPSVHNTQPWQLEFRAGSVLAPGVIPRLRQASPW